MSAFQNVRIKPHDGETNFKSGTGAVPDRARPLREQGLTGFGIKEQAAIARTEESGRGFFPGPE